MRILKCKKVNLQKNSVSIDDAINKLNSVFNSDPTTIGHVSTTIHLGTFSLSKREDFECFNVNGLPMFSYLSLLNAIFAYKDSDGKYVRICIDSHQGVCCGFKKETVDIDKL